ncbi:MAG: 2-amino-4-hydroxy-6-hydroxymethyldihydropteridine diphosphokinase [Puniceicoccales bacterium]|jgi:2-amino-4-hydroxy-6-hydroxymethyldihydropteridine diphosphokinase|nr:2-amino-4-hydroxy-6-hydroxymethyldihydropteridine diphosphokinase [Puniceicoccales bacterium]
MTRVYLSLGTNLGNREAQLRKAVGLLQERFGLFALSSLWETEPWGRVRQPPFLNLTLGLEVSRPLSAFFSRTRAIEQRLGKRKDGFWAARNIDIDLLFWGHGYHRSPQLLIPHPYWYQRAFVLKPLLEIAPLFNPGERSLLFWLRRCEAEDPSGAVRRVGPLEGISLPPPTPLSYGKLEAQGLVLRGIVGVDKCQGLARGGRIPWDIPEDRSFFREQTRGGILCLGRRTAESLPQTFAPGERELWILSRNASFFNRFPDALVFHHPEELRDVQTPKSIWICGGGEVYAQFLPLCSEVYLTQVAADYHCDQFLDPSWRKCFPVIHCLSRSPHGAIWSYRRLGK